MKMIKQAFVAFLFLLTNVGIVKAQYLGNSSSPNNLWLNHPNNLSLGGGINFQNNGYSHLQFKGIMSGTGHVQLDLRKYTGTGNGFDNGRIMTFHPTRGVTLNGIGMNFETGGYSHIQIKSFKNSSNNTRLDIRKYTGSGDGFDGGEFVSFTHLGNVLIGKTSQTNTTYRLDVAGAVRANEIVVNTTGADFVFANGYRLRPLTEVEAFIKANKHLPEIASAAEMQQNGVGLSKLSTQLLQKTEELTLYTIQQEKKIKDLEKKNKALVEQNAQILKRLEALEQKYK